MQLKHLTALLVLAREGHQKAYELLVANLEDDFTRQHNLNTNHERWLRLLLADSSATPPLSIRASNYALTWSTVRRRRLVL